MAANKITVLERFNKYEYIETGIVIVRIDESSEIVFCNHEFADMLDMDQSLIVGRSLDELVMSRELMYDRTKELSKNSSQIAIIGGPNIKFHTTRPPFKLALRLFKISIKRRGANKNLVCYFRELTKLESFLEKTYLNANVDFLWQPITTFLLSGNWRPYATLLSPLWLPYITYHAPDIANFIQTMLHL